jgi:hypothetical protein
LPSYSAATSSTIGAIALHGPHHVAQKSTSTGLSAFNVSAKFASVITYAIVLKINIPVANIKIYDWNYNNDTY